MDVTTIAVIRLKGAIDVNNFAATAQKLYDAGTRNLLVHMSELTFLSSAGIRALQRTARMYSENKQTDIEEGPSGNKPDSGSRFQEHVKLFNPRQDIQDVLEMVGLKGYFEIFTDLDAAIVSFQ